MRALCRILVSHLLVFLAFCSVCSTVENSSIPVAEQESRNEDTIRRSTLRRRLASFQSGKGVGRALILCHLLLHRLAREKKEIYGPSSISTCIPIMQILLSMIYNL